MENQNLGTDNVQSTVDGAGRGTAVPLPGIDATILDQESRVEIPSIISGRPYDAMCKAIRKSGWWLVAWTVFSVFQLNISWAVVLITIALMSFYFYDVAAMFLVYAGMLLWASVWNLLSGDPAWVFLAVTQVVFGILAFRDYRIYRTTKADYKSEPLSQELSPLPSIGREAHMAWLSLFLGAIGLVGLCGLIPAGLILYYMPYKSVEQVINAVLLAIWQLNILGIPVGIAALFTGQRSRAAAAGIIMGTVSLLLLIISIGMAGGGG